MKFSFSSYAGLIDLLKSSGYSIADYHNYSKFKRCAILRHDIDNSINKAVKLAETEAQKNVKSTFFVLLTSDFYNPASKASRQSLMRIRELGHEIGLHFDETAYKFSTNEECISCILRERDILSDILETEISTVSMHRPSSATLQADLVIPGMINSYGNTFFKEFKYLSDSRRRWREPAEELIQSGKYDRLHILTHAFWYNESEKSIYDTVAGFIDGAKDERYAQMADNITDIEQIMHPEKK